GRRAAPGTRTAQVPAYGCRSQEHSVEVTQGGHVELDIALTPQVTATLTGTVTGSGAPVSGAAVSVVGQAGTTTYTDASGAYALTVPHGTHEHRFQATGFAPSTGEVQIDGDAVRDVDLQSMTLRSNAT